MLRIALASIFVIAAATSAPGQDPTQVDAKHYKVILENEQVRVLRIHYGRGEKSVMHDHPAAVAVFLSDQKVRFTTPDGKAVEDAAKAGEAVWHDAGKHLPENIGEGPLDVVLVELKRGGSR